METKINKPYPIIKVDNKNLNYANILLTDYASNISEDTAVHQYIYQHIILKDINKELSDILLSIAITEMKHLDLIGQTINLLGKLPTYNYVNTFTNNDIPFTGNYINYTTDICKLLEHNINLETSAINNYYYQISIINDKNIKILLNRIIEDEFLHLQIFKDFYNKSKTI